MNKQIISLSGFKGHGKDTVGQILAQHAGFTCVSFATPLKHVLSHQFGWDITLLEGITPESRSWREQPDPYWSTKLGRPFTPRQAMTEIGTDLIRRRFLDSQWCDLMQKQIQDLDTPVCITDARFPNELELVRRLGGTTLWVKRLPLPEWYDAAVKYAALPTWTQKLVKPFCTSIQHVHDSELVWTNWQFDHVIDNSHTLADLHDQVLNWYKQTT